MRELTAEEVVTRDRRRAEFQGFVDERCPVLLELAEALQLARADRIVAGPWLFLANLDVWTGAQVIAPEDEAWITTRIGYWLGEALVVRYRGRWFLNELPGSRHFLHYVVGQFKAVGNQNAMLSPMDAVHEYILQPPGRSLRRLMEAICHEIESA